MRTIALVYIMLAVFNNQLKAQQFALYHTGTLYDSFENPSQKAFQTDSSRQYAFNFFIPATGINYKVNGPGITTIKKALYTGKYDTRDLALNEEKLNKSAVNENTYILMFRIFNTVKYHRELGFSWQIKTDAYGETTNRTLVVFQDYRRVVDEQLNNEKYTNNLFKTYTYGQSYHQFGFTYRENYNKRLSYGFKLSYLSGIAYSKMRINSSDIATDPLTGDSTLYLDGDFRTSVYYDDLHRKMLVPGFKNPGVALGIGADYKFKQGWYFMANIKDLGFIKWGKDSYMYSDRNFSIKASTVSDSLWKQIKRDLKQKSYIMPVNGKAEVLLNKDLGNYQPNLILSKNIFYQGGDVAMINTYRYKSLNLSLSTAYDLNGFFALGTQIMLKSPNAEFFIGSDQLFKSMDTGKSFANSDETIGSGYSGASFYFGFALKFGRIMSRQENENYIPGINFKTNDKPGFFQRILGKRE